MTSAAAHNTIAARARCMHAVKVVEVTEMLEVTQEILAKVDPLLDAGNAESAGRLLVHVDQSSLRAILIHILREHGSEVADTVGAAYLHELEAYTHTEEAA